MKRWTFAFTLSTVSLLCETTAADPPSNRDDPASITARLNQILHRLDVIEQHLVELEFEIRLNQEWWVDDRGVMRTRSGRPIGIWGIDGPVTEARR